MDCALYHEGEIQKIPKDSIGLCESSNPITNNVKYLFIVDRHKEGR